MTELYLLCELNDEDYAYAQHSFHKNYKDALQSAIDSCKEWNCDCDIEVENDGWRVTARCGNSFYVTEIKRVCPECGTHLLVWHHGYYGVDFKVLYQGTYEKCREEMEKRIQKLVDDLKLTDDDICEEVVDTGIEWEVFDIIKVEDKNCKTLAYA